MKRVPNTPHALIDTGHRLARLPILLARAIPQNLRLFPDAIDLQILHAYRSLRAVDVVCDDNGMLPWPRADGDFNLGAAAREGRQRGFYKGVHAARGTPPVAVMEAEGLAGQDEGADAILRIVSIGVWTKST